MAAAGKCSADTKSWRINLLDNVETILEPHIGSYTDHWHDVWCAKLPEQLGSRRHVKVSREECETLANLIRGFRDMPRKRSSAKTVPPQRSLFVSDLDKEPYCQMVPTQLAEQEISFCSSVNTKRWDPFCLALHHAT